MELGTGASNANGHGWKGMAKIDNLYQHETKERKRNEPTISSKIKDILEWKLGTGVHLERKDNGDHGSAKKTEKAAEGMRDLWKSRRIESPKNKGPKAGQIYEIVNQHIIEDSMDRTVTISTWREQVDEGHESDTDSTSIYYISPGGYAREDAHIVEVSADFGRQLLGSRHGSRKEQGTPYGAIEANNGPSSKTTKVRSFQSPQRTVDITMTYIQSRANFNGYRHAQYYDIGNTTTDPLRQKNTAVSVGNKEKHTRFRAKEGDARIKRSQGSLTELKVPDGPFMQRRHHYQESTPIEKKLPQPPFHPTRSGSTISSIRPTSTSDFEKFLDGCNPSLVHVSDILKTLGIYKLEHLKAVARLSPEMRDREVKQVALRLGMTVMEWAILVDKAFQL